ncbi:hypothetical protein Droror1_Dr00026661 [Drosera rotundifolia]
MAFKRALDIEIPNEVLGGSSFKHQRLVENSDRTSSNLHDVTSTDDAQRYHYSVDGPTRKDEPEVQEKPANAKHPDYRGYIEEETEDGSTRSLSFSPWAAQSPSDDENIDDSVMHLPRKPEYFSFDSHVRPTIHVNDIYHLLFDYPPRKQVPIGQNHQADIPNLLSRDERDSRHGDNIHYCGTCVFPCPELDLPSSDENQVGAGRSDCKCRDRGSLRCVRQHIEEARQDLRSSIGLVAFSELGFHGMGEVVAKKWSEDEARLFHEVVFCNPASLGRNFWKALSFIFPYQTKMELVGYYFNVFMLQKRAEQNRVDPMHIDSDDDEWQGTEDDINDEGGVTEDDEDSVVGSPEFHHGSLHYWRCSAENDEDVDEVCDEVEDIPASLPRTDLSSSGDADLVLGKIFYDEAGENENQDGSCTSSDSGAPSQEGLGNTGSCDRWDYILEPCDSKVWDSYLSCPEKKVDLLPTCSMIEEVFGNGAFDLQGKRW